MPEIESPGAVRFAERLCQHPADALAEFAEIEILTGRPFIFSEDLDLSRLQDHIARGLGVRLAASEVLIVGSAKTGFSLDPDRFALPFRPSSDVDIVVISADMFDHVWHTMLAWDYLTIKARTKLERQWLYGREPEIWRGWCEPGKWRLRDRSGFELSFSTALKPLRDFSYQWFSVFRSLSRYRHHAEIPRHTVNARLYRSRQHVRMYHASGLRTLRARLMG